MIISTRRQPQYLLSSFSNLPFGLGTEVLPNDFFTGDGSTKSFTLTQKTGLDLASVVQAGAVQYFANNGGVSVSGNVMTLNSAPPLAASIIAPGIVRMTFQGYGQASVVGLGGSPNVSITPVYFADIDEIATQQYLPTSGKSGIEVQLVDHDVLNGADASWFQLAPFLADGTAGTFGSAGAALDTPSIVAYDTLQSGISALATSITVADGSQFNSGRFILLEAGTVNQDQIQVVNISGNVLTTTPTNLSHLIGANVYENGFGMYVQLTLPTNITTIRNYYDVAVDIIFDQISRT